MAVTVEETPILKVHSVSRSESWGQPGPAGSPGLQGCGGQGWTGLAHSPSPKKDDILGGCLWMRLQLLSHIEAWAAWRFQKAGSSSSTAQSGEWREWSAWGRPGEVGFPERLVTWDEAEGEL